MKNNQQIMELMEQNKKLMEMLKEQNKPAERQFIYRKKRKFSKGWFIFWILICWPIAILQVICADVVEEKVYLD